jgi:Ca2+-binding RTX toxin-like protein
MFCSIVRRLGRSARAVPLALAAAAVLGFATASHSANSSGFCGATPEHDNIVLTSGNDSCDAYAGNDNVAGLDGSDYINGGQGNDNVSGGTGGDALFGDMIGEVGNDKISGGPGNDGSFSLEPLRWSCGVCDYGGGADDLSGGDGSDVIDTQSFFGVPAGPDNLSGGSGDDFLNSLDLEANDRVSCGSGYDIAFVDPGDLVAPDCESVRNGF